MADSLLSRAKAVRETVLLAELGAWLHDLGKLSYQFVESKTDPAYVTADAGPETKPATGEWPHGAVLTQDREKISQQLWDFLCQSHLTALGAYTLSGLISDHHLSKPGHILALLKQADHNDSGEDEYNVVALPQSRSVQRATVFGLEDELDLTPLDALRQSLYAPLEALATASPYDRDKVWQLLRPALNHGLGKTQRAEERYQAEKAEYETKIQAREARAREEQRKPRGRKPKPPQQQGPRDQDQYNFTDPDSRVMKNSTDKGFDQHYNVQVAVEQDSFLIVAHSLSNHPTDRHEALPTLDAIAPEVGTPEAAALDTGYFSATNITAMEQRGIEPYIATGRDTHHKSWRSRFAASPAPPSEDASPLVKMAYKLKTEIGQEIYKLRKSTVEPVIGIIKEIMGFRQFSLRGLAAAAGEWCLVCLAFNLKRLHVLLAGQL